MHSAFDQLVSVSPIGNVFGVVNQSASLSLDYTLKVRYVVLLHAPHFFGQSIHIYYHLFIILFNSESLSNIMTFCLGRAQGLALRGASHLEDLLLNKKKRDIKSGKTIRKLRKEREKEEKKDRER